MTKSFTAVGLSNELAVRQGESISYDISGTFVATVVVEQQQPNKDWAVLATATGAASGTVVGEHPGLNRFRFRCSAFTSGTADCVLARQTSDVTATRRSVDGTKLEETTNDGLHQYSPMLTTPKGCVHAIEATFTETGAGTYTGSVTVPAGASILDILVNGVALWTAATSAAMDVGDGDDPDGFFAAIDLKATDLLAGESISFAQAGGKAGAYIANSQVSPRYSASARTISGVVTSVGAGAAGRTRMTVVYHLPVSADIVAATKA